MHFSSVALSLLLVRFAASSVAPPTKVFKARDSNAQPGIPACSTAAAVPKPTSLVCGKQGVLSYGRPIMKAIKTADQTQCRGLCLNNDQCIAFAFNENSLKCTLYPESIHNQGFHKDSSSGTFYWNRACYKITCTCPNDRTLCTGPYCANLESDPSNCGYCGNICPPDETCTNGVCVTTTCSNVIDCDNGIYGSQTNCGHPICYCADVDGSSDGGLCTPDTHYCQESQKCKSSDDCGTGHFCSLKTCCGFGICNKYLAPRCGNPHAPSQMFAKPARGPNHKMPSGAW